ncbi:RES family NAD+ phosphorylase [Chenggangzhangella methanolivorans]|uniref:RES family NAD+ phosphorylase n=1 Tax=Chenggangzhangella methanolivorans TaxID=1437009 RepID=A0A9E6UQE0_9HYPH|nr:RES family NAD+ phosphorylase [Chenggangzhangella methanolivorans]
MITLPAGARVSRFFTAGYDPIYFDTGLDGRLNAPDGSYGVLYAAETASGAFAETFLRQPGRRLIPPDLLTSKAYAELEFTRPTTFVQLQGPGLAVLGATAEVTHAGENYDLSQAWSAKLQAHPVNADGIAYRSRHDDGQTCFAVFDRALPAVREASRIVYLDTDWFWEVADPYEVGLAPA